jgi:sialate O-acetylesterase
MFLACVLLASSVYADEAAGKLQVNGLFSDNMVLQTSARGGFGPGVLKGLAQKGQTVTLASVGKNDFPGAPLSATADVDGVWSIALSKDGTLAGPFDLALSAGGGKAITASNVWFGELFLCGGQSNMEYTVGAIKNATAELAAAAHSNIHLFQVNKLPTWNDKKAVEPTEIGRVSGSCLYGGEGNTNPCDIMADPAPWRQANSTWVNRFSAICYLAARDVMQLHLGSDVKIGLIESDYGGTPVQAWTPAEGLTKCGMQTKVGGLITMCKRRRSRSMH